MAQVNQHHLTSIKKESLCWNQLVTPSKNAMFTTLQLTTATNDLRSSQATATTSSSKSRTWLTLRDKQWLISSRLVAISWQNWRQRTTQDQSLWIQQPQSLKSTNKLICWLQKPKLFSQPQHQNQKQRPLRNKKPKARKKSLPKPSRHQRTLTKKWIESNRFMS